MRQALIEAVKAIAIADGSFENDGDFDSSISPNIAIPPDGELDDFFFVKSLPVGDFVSSSILSLSTLLFRSSCK